MRFCESTGSDCQDQWGQCSPTTRIYKRKPSSLAQETCQDSFRMLVSIPQNSWTPKLNHSTPPRTQTGQVRCPVHMLQAINEAAKTIAPNSRLPTGYLNFQSLNCWTSNANLLESQLSRAQLPESISIVQLRGSNPPKIGRGLSKGAELSHL